jgi:oligoendopeptidase F
MSQKILQRSDVEEKYKWNNKYIYSNQEAWEIDFGFFKICV